MTSSIPQTGVNVKGYIYYHVIATHNCDYLPLGLVDPWGESFQSKQVSSSFALPNECLGLVSFF